MGWCIARHEILKIVEMRSYISVSCDDVPFAVILEIPQYTRLYIIKGNFCCIAK